jgi:hypothetical protein
MNQNLINRESFEYSGLKVYMFETRLLNENQNFDGNLFDNFGQSTVRFAFVPKSFNAQSAFGNIQTFELKFKG